MPVPDECIHELTTLAGVVLAQDDLSDAIREICRIAVRAVPGAEGASLSTFDKGSPAATSDGEWSQGLDEMQYTEHEGPCFDAVRTGNIFRVKDLANDTRWPFYGPRAAA